MPFTKGISGNPAGKKKGTKGRLTLLTEKQRQQLAERMGISPLEFLISVLRDPDTAFDHKLEAAKIAAPYMHRRMPIAIEGGDPAKPIAKLDASHLRNLNKAERETLRALLAKLGMGTEIDGG